MVQDFSELEIWKKGRELVSMTYKLASNFPKNEQYGLISQMQRASISVPSNIAEGFSRHGTKDYVNFLSVSIGSLAELTTQSYLVEDLCYIDAKKGSEYREFIGNLTRMLQAMRSKLKAKL